MGEIDVDRKDQATDLFGTERVAEASGIVGTVMQTFGERIVSNGGREGGASFVFHRKNHVFLDGNKRSGAYALFGFCVHKEITNIPRTQPSALLAIVAHWKVNQKKRKSPVLSLPCFQKNK